MRHGLGFHNRHSPGRPITPTDPNWSSVTLLLPGDGTNGAQNNTFLDASTNNFTVTRNGNTTQGTFTPFGANWSNYFDGSGDLLSVPDNTAFNLSGGVYTLEAWINPNGNYSDFRTIISKRVTGTNSCAWQIYLSQTTGRFGFYNGTIYESATVPVANAWSHVAAVYDGTNINLYVNGTRVLQTAVTNSNVAADVRIGWGGTLNEYFAGYISNVRVVKGTQVYTGTTYTVPTAPLTAISGTSLLTCQSNRFIDNSANNFTVTRTGDVSVQRFNPFSPTDAYSASVIGGSGYFDGNGDYLSVLEADVDETLWYSGQFTLEYWIYPLAFGGTSNNASYSNVIGWASPTTSGEGFDFGPNSSGLVITYYFNGAQQYQPSTTSIRLREWAHLAIVGNNGSMTMYVNGQNAGGAFTYSGTPTGGFNFLIGKITSGGNFNGYLNSIRVSTTRRYTTTFTPPTAPLTSDASTKLLLNFTNAGIIDNAMMNDLETVGNAQISTAQSRFGGASILFNGTTGYLTAPTNTEFGFGTGDFTMECWVYTVGYGGTGSVVMDLRSGVEPSVKPDFEFTSAGVPIYRVNGATQITGSAVSTGAWTHLALCRASGTTRMFVNGTQVGSSYADANNYGASSRLSIGVDDDGSPNAYFNGYIDDLRITKGVARYTANFTPPAAAFPTS